MDLDRIDILLVEDEAAHAALVQRAFKARGEAVHLRHADTLAEARRQLERSLPDLAIVDLRLPDGDGIELLVVEDGMPLFPVVIMTSHGDEQVAVEAMKAGALDYVVKSEAMLVQMPRIVERVLREWGHIVERRRAEKALRESEIRFRSLFAHSPVAIWEADYAGVKTFLDLLPLTEQEDVRDYFDRHPEVVRACAHRVCILAVNEAAVQLFEADGAGPLQETASVLVAGEMGEAFKQELLAIHRGERLLELEAVARTLKGNRRDVTLRWTVPPGHEQDYSRVLISMVDVTERKRLEKEILEISGREQRRIGRDLHDGLGQLLGGVRFKIARLRQCLQRRGIEAEAEMLDEIDQFIAEAMTQARALAQGLSPVSVEEDGLTQALRGLVYTVERLGGIPCTLHVDEPVSIGDPEVATQLYRIAQEALTNAMRHSRATRLQVILAREGSSVTLTVRDNGVGIPKKAARREGMGLHIMRYRARMIQADLEVRNLPEGGTQVSCRFSTATTLRSSRALSANES